MQISQYSVINTTITVRMNGLTEKRVFLSADKVNFIIALCAILISLASFYATYLQASAAEKQVKAMTLPLMVFEHGNYDSQLKRKVISFVMENSGSGAAIVHNTKLVYNGVAYSSINEFLKACCNSEYESYRKNFDKPSADGYLVEDGGFISSPINGVVVPSQSERKFFQFFKHSISDELWNKVNNERWKLETEYCYCTLLDDCFISKGNAIAEPVAACSIDETN